MNCRWSLALVGSFFPHDYFLIALSEMAELEALVYVRHPLVGMTGRKSEEEAGPAATKTSASRPYRRFVFQG